MTFALIGIVATNAKAQTVINSGTTGDLTWQLTSDSILTISGVGVMPDYSSGGSQPWGYSKMIRKVIVEEGVTSIGRCAFFWCEIVSVNIPNSVTSIGKYAFYACDVLRSITIPNSVISIEELAFDESGIDTIYVFWETPLSIPIGNDFFGVEYGADISNINLIVPCGLISIYDTVDVWSEFRISEDCGSVFNEELQKQNSKPLQAYPNPVLSNFTVLPTTAGATIDIYNSVGLRIATCKAAKEQTTLNLQGLPAGIYFVKIGSKTVKIVKR